MTLDETRAAIAAEALRRRAARDGEAREPVPPAPEPLTFAYLERFDAGALVARCYELLLGRPADAAGMTHYLSALERGRPKALVVASIAYSPEARRRKARVAGLLPRALRALVAGR